MFPLRKMLFACFVLFWIGSVSANEISAVEQKIKEDPDLSEFYELLGRSPLAKAPLQYKQVTIFAPINVAFQTHSNPMENPDEIIPYHITSVPKKTDQLGTSYTSLFSELTGSPILWVTHTTGTYHDDIYINNARVLISQSNIQVMQNGNEQVIHKIDEILIPTRSSKTAAVKIYNPTAWEFLENHESLIMGEHRVRSYRQSVETNKKQDIFKTEGGHTFFIPVDEGFRGDRASHIDGRVIDGHVIPRQVLFTAPTKKGEPFQTLANGDNNIRVVISFTQELRGNNRIVHYVKSHTILTDGKHTQGVVLAEIVKPNIPVKNGVIHLIQKPLMIVDNTVKDLLLENQGGILSKFVTAINQSVLRDEIFKRLDQPGGQLTFFAPCSAAWDDDLALNSLIRDPMKFKEILYMHIVEDQRLFVDRIIQNNEMKIYQFPTLNKRQNLYFNVVSHGHNRTITVEGGGVNSTVLQADLAATNGVIHVIDRVLGIPYTTILDKLEQDHMLNITYRLGMKQINRRLNDTTKRFTYFVPRDKAWSDARIKMPSTIKVLFMPEYSYHANNILEHHLVISDAPFSMERIKLLSNESYQQNKFKREVELPTIRGGSLRLYVEEKHDHSYFIHWNGERIPVYRPDVECTNGIIHVIDMPLLQESDVKINGASMLWLTSQVMMLAVTTWLII